MSELWMILDWMIAFYTNTLMSCLLLAPHRTVPSCLEWKESIEPTGGSDFIFKVALNAPRIPSCFSS